MKLFNKILRPISFFLITFMLFTASPFHYASAKMIGTENAITYKETQDARQYVNTMMSREDVKKTFASYGVDQNEALKRVNALSDAEVVALANQMETAPAGGDFLSMALGAVLFVFIVLLITDLLGLTDAFPFVNSQKT